MKRRLPLAGRPSLAPRPAELDAPRAIDRVTRPVYAVWEITLRCDLACKHCGSRAGRPRADELSTAEALDLVSQMAALDVREVTLIGGEAYLRDDWLEIVRAVRARGMHCTIVTGGRGIDDARAQAARDAGLDGAAVSVDGLEATHDALRGVAGSWSAAARAMSALRGAGIPVSVNTTLNQRNMSELEALGDVVFERGAHAWQVALVVPMGRAADDPSLLVQPFELDALYPRLAAEARRARARGVRFVRGNNVGYFGPLEEAFQGDASSDDACGCGAGREILGVEADGAIKGCPSLSTDAWSGGTIREASLQELWERSRPLQRLREPRDRGLSGFCATCYYAPECGGGCTWMAEALFGEPGNNPYCHHRVLEQKRAGLRERVVRIEAPPGRPFDRGRFELVVEPW